MEHSLLQHNHLSIRIIGGYEHHSLKSIYYTLLHLMIGSLVRGVDKFVRVGGAGMLLSVYMQQLTAILLGRVNLKNCLFKNVQQVDVENT